MCWLSNLSSLLESGYIAAQSHICCLYTLAIVHFTTVAFLMFFEVMFMSKALITVLFWEHILSGGCVTVAMLN